MAYIGRPGRPGSRRSAGALAEIDQRRPAADDGPSPLDYWAARERWAALGKRIQSLAAEARKMGVPLEVMPGATGLIGDFKALGRRLDGLAR